MSVDTASLPPELRPREAPRLTSRYFADMQRASLYAKGQDVGCVFRWIGDGAFPRDGDGKWHFEFRAGWGRGDRGYATRWHGIRAARRYWRRLHREGYTYVY